MKRKKIINKLIPQLCDVYKSIPETKGCMENLTECKSWCCLTPDVRVYALNGLIPISLLKEGDYVFTRIGIKKILKTGSKQWDGSILKIKSCYGRTMTVTPDHQILTDTFNKKNREVSKETVWHSGSDLICKRRGKKGHYLIFPKINNFMNETTDNVIRITDFIDGINTDGKNCLLPKAKNFKKIPLKFYLDYDFCWILGLYLAEGSVSRSSIDFHIHDQEFDFRKKIEQFAKKYDLKCSCKINKGHSLTVRVFSKILSLFFEKLCGKHCDKKCINKDLFKKILSSKRCLQGIHDGLYDGDGTKRLSKKQKYVFTTTSIELVYQMQMINLLMNHFPSFRKNTKEGKKDWYTLSISNGKFKDYVETENDFRVPIKNVKKEMYSGLVYDIEVEESHSFLTECGEVHNCEFQSPQVFMIEYQNAWGLILRTWNIDQIADLIEKCIRLYLSNLPTKGCIFWDKEKYVCQIHKARCYNCRIYGITPDEEFNPRYKRFKEQLKGNSKAVVRDQCKLCSTVSGNCVTTKDTQKWFDSIMDLEHQFGIKRENINDEYDGSYRTYHDHILLSIMPKEIMEDLSKMRSLGSAVDPIQKEKAIQSLAKAFRNNITKIIGETNGSGNKNK